jgi:hypothetical protein
MRTAATPAQQAATADSKPTIHAFKAGRHTTMGGEVIEFSEADLAATAAAYNPALSRAPLVVGHPKTDDPAQGWVAGLAANERGLFAQADQLDPAFTEAVRAGRYGAVSAKFYRPTDAANPVPGVWYLRHVGFLGAAAPAIKGLDAPQFSDDGDGVCFADGVAFSGWTDRTVASLLRGLRDWMLTKFGREEADRVLPSYSLSDLEADAQRELDVAVTAAAFSEPAPASAAPATASAPVAAPAPTPPTEHTVTEQEAQALREQLAANQRELDTLRAAEATRHQQAVQAENVAFAEGLARDARIPTGQVALVAAIGQQLQASAEVQFGEGDAAQPLHQAWRGLMQALPPLAGTGEQATRERAATTAAASGDAEFAEADPDRLQLHARIQAHAKANGLSYESAAHALAGTAG